MSRPKPISEKELARLEQRYAALRRQFPDLTDWMKDRTPSQIEAVFRRTHRKQSLPFQRKIDRIYAKLPPQLRAKLEDGADLDDREWAIVERAKARSSLFRAKPKS